MAAKRKNKRRDVEDEESVARPEKLGGKAYEHELARLHAELVKLQLWVVARGLKVVVVFEGRDGAGKGGVIKAITERVSPASSEWLLCLRRQSAKSRRCISSAMCVICLPPARSSSSTAAGTIGQASSG